MPGFIAHLLFGQQTAAYSFSDHQTAFNLGLQGPDIFFYHIPAYTKYPKNIGNVMHSVSTGLFFKNLLESRYSFTKVDDLSVCDAYISGFIGHYTLDTWCHPFIYHFTHHFDNLDTQGKNYDFGVHVSYETDIDHMLIDQFKHCLPSQFDYAAQVRLSASEESVVVQLLFSAINLTYPEFGIKNSTIKGAIHSFINLNHAMHDPSGHKKALVARLEKLIVGCCFISAMVPSDTIIKNSDPLNLSHSTWHNPWDESLVSSESFLERFNSASREYEHRINLYHNYITAYDASILEDLGNLSYLSGISVDLTPFD